MGRQMEITPTEVSATVQIRESVIAPVLWLLGGGFWGWRGGERGEGTGKGQRKGNVQVPSGSLMRRTEERRRTIAMTHSLCVEHRTR